MTNADVSHSLEHQLLIAMPQLLDPFFAQSVTYLWKHNSDGAIGIVINKPLSASIADIFDELDIKYPQASNGFRSHRVLAGGPVERDKGFILYKSHKVWDSSIALSNEINISTSRDILEDIAHGKGPEHYLLALGCAGWEAGQLEKEVSQNAWLTAPAPSDLVFSDNYAEKAARAAAQLGISLEQLSPEAGHS